MTISNKIKGLLKIRGKKAVEYSESLKLNKPTALNTKYTRESFKAQDLVILADLTKTRLAFIDENDKPIITFDMDDLSEDK